MKKNVITALAGVMLVGVLFSSIGLAQAVNNPGAVQVNTSDQVDRDLNGSNSPFIVQDERLDRFQDRFDLTDEQVNTLVEKVNGLVENGASREEIRNTVQSQLEEFGVDSPEVGPIDGERQRLGQHNGNGYGNGDCDGMRKRYRGR